MTLAKISLHCILKYLNFRRFFGTLIFERYFKNNALITHQCSPHIETSQFICTSNHWAKHWPVFHYIVLYGSFLLLPLHICFINNYTYLTFFDTPYFGIFTKNYLPLTWDIFTFMIKFRIGPTTLKSDK